MRILVVEDEAGLRRPLAALLRRQGHEVAEAGSLEEAWEAFVELEPDLISLDVMLPEGEEAGFTFAERLRASGYQGPILFVTARDAIEDRVQGLDLGGDDYLVKPFSLEEYAARVRALLRRKSPLKQNRFAQGPLEVDLAARRVFWQGEEVPLTGREFALLELFVRQPERVFSKEELLDRLFPGVESGPKIVQVYVHRLRQKLAPWVVVTTPTGYRLGTP